MTNEINRFIGQRWSVEMANVISRCITENSLVGIDTAYSFKDGKLECYGEAEGTPIDPRYNINVTLYPNRIRTHLFAHCYVQDCEVKAVVINNKIVLKVSTNKVIYL